MAAHKIKVATSSSDATIDHPESVQAESAELELLNQRIDQLESELNLAKQREQRALADYQNVVRRSVEDKSKLIKLAGRELVSDLLEPLSHLRLAAAQLNDPGLTMVVKQLWQKLDQNGLAEIEVLGLPFDVNTMEATEILAEGPVVVIKVVTPGYTLNGEVIQHAKVVLGLSN